MSKYLLLFKDKEYYKHQEIIKMKKQANEKYIREIIFLTEDPDGKENIKHT